MEHSRVRLERVLAWIFDLTKDIDEVAVDFLEAHRHLWILLEFGKL